MFGNFYSKRRSIGNDYAALLPSCDCCTFQGVSLRTGHVVLDGVLASILNSREQTDRSFSPVGSTICRELEGAKLSFSHSMFSLPRCCNISGSSNELH